VGSSPDATLLISPELVLVDPELRALALVELDQPTSANSDRLTGSNGASSAAANKQAEAIADSVPKAFRAHAPRTRRMRTALGVSLVVNLVLLAALTVPSLQALPAKALPSLADWVSGNRNPAVAVDPVGSEHSTASTTPSNVQRNASSGSRSRPTPSARRAKEHPLSNQGRAGGTVTTTATGGRRRTTTAAPSRMIAERHVLAFLARASALPQFLDPETKLVRANVAVRCITARPSGTVSQASAFECWIWQQPGSPSSGVKLLYRIRPDGGRRIDVSPVARS
jgi:hypothetical protein